MDQLLNQKLETKNVSKDYLWNSTQLRNKVHGQLIKVAFGLRQFNSYFNCTVTFFVMKCNEYILQVYVKPKVVFILLK